VIRVNEANHLGSKTTEKPELQTSGTNSGTTAGKLPLNPEEQELARKRAEQSAIETELAERELRSANLRAELGAFEQQYLHFVGARYAELDELRAGIAEITEISPRAFEASPEMKRLYRDVAKRIHPDLTADRQDRAKRQILMAEANKAYELGDEARLARILTEYEWSPEQVRGEGAGAELVRVIRGISQARGRLAEIEAELQELLRSDLYQLKTRVDEAQQGGRDVLKEMIDKVDDQIAQAKRRLDAVLAPAR
jgi:hypothetical protein